MNIKTIGANGQVTVGTKYAGQSVAIEEIEPGVWLMKIGDFIPRNERWLYDHEVADKLERAVDWAKTHNHEETDLVELERRLSGDDSST